MSDFDFDDFLDALSGEDWEEKPVTIEQFVTDDDYLGIPLRGIRLSDYQYEALRRSTQIFKRDTLHSLYGIVEGEARWKELCNEVILMLGKGSGKDFISTIACAYIVYQLLCLREPAVYYGKPPGDAIDILNIAVNAVQANNVFFKGFKEKIERSPWFEGKYITKAGSIEFDKNVTVHSGHSEREAWEGYNVIAVFLDEISAFAMEKETDREGAKTAQAIYDMYRASVRSRFAEVGKLVMLSFPRFKGDFISKRYDEVIAEKETELVVERVKLDPDLPDGIEGNEFDITWERDHITRYKFPRTYALRRPTWVINPIKHVEDYVQDFYENPNDAYGRVAAMPSDVAGGFFKNHDAIDNAFVKTNAVDRNGIFLDDWKPKPDTKYYLHVDLAQKHDYAAVAVAHVEKWVNIKIGAVNYSEYHPYVVVDLIRWWVPTRAKSIDFADIRDFVVAIRRKGFDIGLVTFDRWNSHDTINYLKKHGIKAEMLSLKKTHYDDFLSVMYDGRLLAPDEEEVRDELKNLVEVRGKVDHVRGEHNDRAEAICGAIWNTIQYTKKKPNDEVQVHTYQDIVRKAREEEEKAATEKALTEELEDGIIRPPRAMPPDIAAFLSDARLL